MKRILYALFVLIFTAPVCASDHIVVLLDTSGSMDTRMRNVKTTRIEAAKMR